MRRLEGARERLDDPRHDPATLERSLAHVAAVNRWLGGRRALFRHLPARLADRRTTAILDVGTGSAGLPLAVARWARRHRRSVAVTAVDAHPQVAGIARRHAAGTPAVRVVAADGLTLPFPDRTFDIGLLTLTLHHFEGDAQVRVLQELARVVRGWIIVGELHRAWPNYLGARLLAATVWRRNPLTRHDGPMSVLRAFRPDELRALARAAGLRDVAVRRHPFYRLVLTARSG